MGALETLLTDILLDAGLNQTYIKARTALELPGYYRPEKKWDLLVVADGRLVAAIEFKSQVGPSFGNNFNNRTEEAIGNAEDIWTAYREGRFGKGSPPFLGYFSCLKIVQRSTHRSKTLSPTSRWTHSSRIPRMRSGTKFCANAWCWRGSTTLLVWPWRQGVVRRLLPSLQRHLPSVSLQPRWRLKRCGSSTPRSDRVLQASRSGRSRARSPRVLLKKPPVVWESSTRR